MDIGFVLYLVSIATSCRIFCIVGTVIFYTVVALPEASASDEPCFARVCTRPENINI